MNLWFSILFINIIIAAVKPCRSLDNLDDSSDIDSPLTKILRNQSNFTIIDNAKSCLGANLNFICYHNGKCISKYSYLNDTYILKSYYCVCDYVS